MYRLTCEPLCLESTGILCIDARVNPCVLSRQALYYVASSYLPRPHIQDFIRRQAKLEKLRQAHRSEDEARKRLEAGPDRCCSPHHATHFFIIVY